MFRIFVSCPSPATTTASRPILIQHAHARSLKLETQRLEAGVSSSDWASKRTSEDSIATRRPDRILTGSADCENGSSSGPAPCIIEAAATHASPRQNDPQAPELAELLKVRLRLHVGTRPSLRISGRWLLSITVLPMTSAYLGVVCVLESGPRC